MTNQVFYYDNIVQDQPTKITTTKEVYYNIKNGAYSLQTNHILETYFDNIADGFDSYNKEPYQKLKRETLHAVTFSGKINRHTGEIYSHSGLITLDIDNNSKDDLNSLFERITDGLDAAIDACGVSVSGIVNGSMWCNVRVTIPNNPKTKLSKKLKKLVGIVDGDNRSEAITKLHKAYYRAIVNAFTTKYGVKLAATQNPKRLRYLSDDPNIYINPHNTCAYTLQFLEDFLTAEERAKKKAKKFDKATTNINTNDAYQFAYQFARNKGTDFVKGEKHNFRMFFAVACNLLGVSQSDCTNYIQEHYPSGNGKLKNCITSPYKNYAPTHGMWSYKLKPLQTTIHIPKGKYLSDIVNEIIPHYKRELLMGKRPMFCLMSGTGTGKTHAIIKHIAPTLTDLTGKKSIFVCNLNLLAEQTAKKANTIPLTGTPTEENLLKAFNNDLIVCNHNALPTIAKYCIENNIKVNSFIDESHTLVTGANYKPVTVANVLKYANTISHSITLLSATPKDYFLHVGFKRIEITNENQTPIQLTKVITKEQPENIALNHIENTNFDDGKILLIKIQSKNRINRIYDSLLSLGYTDEQVLKLYSEKDIKEKNYYQRLINANENTDTFDNCVKIVLCTSFINEGVNLYSSKQIEFLNVERFSRFDYINFMQFVARWRTSKSKRVYSYHPPTTEEPTTKNSQDEHIKAFISIVDYWTKKVNQCNEEIKQNDKYVKESIVNTYTDKNNTQKHILWNREKGKFVLNVLACALDAERVYMRNMDTKQAYKRLQSEFPNVEIIEGKPLQVQQTTKDLTNKQKEITRNKRKKAKSQLNTLFQKDMFPLLLAFLLKSENMKLRKKVLYHFPELNSHTIHYNELRTQAMDTINENKELFMDNFNLVESLVFYMCRVLDGGFSREQSVDILTDKKGKLRSYQKLKVIFEHLNIWRLLYIGSKKNKENYLTKTQLKDHQKFQKVQNEILKQVNPKTNEISHKTALLTVYSVMGKGYSQKQAKELIFVLFEAKTIQRKPIYEITAKNGFKDLFLSLKISESKNVKIVDNLLIINAPNTNSNNLFIL